MPTQQGIGPWTLGKDLSAFTVAPVVVTPNAGGTGTTWTAGTAISCTGVVRRIMQQTRVATRDIRPITQVQENQVPISTGNSLQIQDLRVAAAAAGTGNPLAVIVNAGLYIQVVFHDAASIWDGYYVITGFESGFDGLEEQIESVDLGPVALTSRGQVIYTA